jgi:hypothetical protein
LKFIVTAEEWNALAERVRELYSEKDGKYELQVDNLPASPTPPEDTAALKSALTKEREKAKETLIKSPTLDFADPRCGASQHFNLYPSGL